ncbi:hypothetical protein BDV95DRAFT_484865 [Massariosphaeria phaeospora]|uniref:rRNA-processing protein EFG1 n=1 Tax=Massariosphaeria phaeospora TaxID=100035 RepID=A0A7C8MF97_9PLEO|nr:hypothetical protein BDV95DRAFT_484865 [Massariosphaeria phaeospora]
MSQKRKRTELSGEGRDGQKSAKKQRDNFQARGPYSKAKGHRRPQPSQDEQKTTSSSELRSRIRDLKRLLDRVDCDPKYRMPANVRVDRERELETCEHELAEKTAAKREAEFRTKIIGKYHQVRFFDRRKATRILKRLYKELTSLEDQSERADLLRRIHNVEVDLSYTTYYPLLKPYSSLYPKTSQGASKSDEPTNDDELSNQQSGDQVDGPKGDPEMWKAVEQAMIEGTLRQLRDSKPGAVTRRLEDKVSEEKKQKKKDKRKPQSGTMQQMLKDTKASAVPDEGDESDGGFFE